jgi:mediator of RNA polymerase II transcription subunit 7
LEDLRNLFINAHHLLNLYRPHQARESLVLMMEEQLDRTREEIEKIDRTKELIENLLERLRTDGADAASAFPSRLMDSKNVGDLEDGALKEARQVWDLLNDDQD